MTKKIGAFDFTKLHIAPDLGLYERRLRHVVTDCEGNPKRLIPDGVTYHSWHRFMTRPKTDRVVRAYVLVPVIAEQAASS